MVKAALLLLSLTLSSQSWAEEDSPNFNEDAFIQNIALEDSGEEGDELEELEGFEFEEDAENINDDFSNDLKSIPKQQTPKLNPRTQVVTTKKGKYIYHPNQEKGLYKITRNNEYHYKYKKSKLEGFIHVKGGNLNLENFPQEFETADADGNTSLFQALYDKGSITTVYLEYEWKPLKGNRSLSLKAGTGISYARGKGRFVSGENEGQTSDEAYTMMMFPLSAGAIYKFHLWSDQLFMPFATAGVDYNLFTEFRSGFEAFKYAGVLAGHAGGGVLLNLGWLERAAALEMDREFGINNTYLSLEARFITSFYDEFDTTGLVFLAGLSFEY